MQTDVILRRLTALRAADLLPLLGAADATLVRVESPELASRAVRLDLVLHLRLVSGAEYLHLVEWQGYTKTDLLWRTMRYLAELGEQWPGQPIRCTIVYLTPDDDVGGGIEEAMPDVRGWWSFQVDTLRLWELDAATYATIAPPGLAVLSPVMQGARAELVFLVAQRIIAETSADEQAELLSMLSVFAEALIEPTTFLELVGKERVMTGGVIGLLVREQVAEETARLTEVIAERDQRMRQILLRHIDSVLAMRFPGITYATARKVQQITDIDALERLVDVLMQSPDEAAATASIVAAVEQSA